MKLLRLLFVVFLGVLLAGWIVGPRKIVVYNATKSLPSGFYRLTAEAPAKGRIISFPLPARIRPYIAWRMGKAVSDDWNLLKPIVAAAGDRVCVTDDGLSVNGRWLADVPETDSLGNPIPVWRECRELAAGEFFVFSDRIERSLDSRYVGPIKTRDIRGVYVPLWTWGD